MRTLRSYRHIAQTEHFCDRCCRHIHPGEMYEGLVQVYKGDNKSRLLVLKMHIYPSCDYPDNDPDSDEYRLLERIKREEKIKNSLSVVHPIPKERAA